MTESRSTFAQQLGAAKVESTLLVLFIPSVDRDSQPIDQDTWVHRALETLGALFGGATAFPQGQGVWRDDAQGGRLVFDEPVVINCYTSETASIMAPATPFCFWTTQKHLSAKIVIISMTYAMISPIPP